MTVFLSATQTYSVSKRDMGWHVRNVLRRNRRYKAVRELEWDTLFTGMIRSYPFLLNTALDVELSRARRGTQVVVTTTSQLISVGDILGLYNRYINEFLKPLGQEVTAEHGNAATERQPDWSRRKVWWPFPVYAFTYIVGSLLLMRLPKPISSLLNWLLYFGLLLIPDTSRWRRNTRRIK